MRLIVIILGLASALGAQALPMGTSYTPFGVKSRNQGPNWTTGAAATCSYNANKFDIGGYPLNEEVGQCTTGFVQALTGSVLVPATSTRETHSAGVAGYAKTLSSNPGGGAVGVFGLGVLGAVSGAWGANFSCNTFATGGGNHVGNCWGIEVDMNAHGSPQPAPANMWGITVVSSFYQQAAGDTVGVKIQRAITSNAKWKVGFETQSGSVDIGLQLGPTDETAQAGSAPINFLARDVSLASRQATISLDDAVNLRYMADGVHQFGNSALSTNYASIRSTGILPGTNDAQDLGSSAPLVRWRALYSTYAFLTSTGFEPTATNTYLLGSNGLRWAVAYGVEADFAPLSIAGANSKTTLRRLRLADDAGATTFWDVRSNSTSTTSNFIIRDEAAVDYLTLGKIASSSTDRRAILNAILEPTTDATFDLGSSTKRWNVLHLDPAGSNINGHGIVSPVNDGADSLGTSTKRWAALHSMTGTFYNLLQSPQIAPIVDGGILGDPVSSLRWAELHLVGGANINANGLMAPINDNTDDLGAPTNRWQSFYTMNARFYSTITAPSGNTGLSTTLSCSAGLAVKSITVSGGIVTSASCGAP